MSWAFGIENGREVGYAVEATCDAPGCDAKINRGISYRCGETRQLHGGHGCGGFFCSTHKRGTFCAPCEKTVADDDE